jgi:hypothetical protein
MAALSVETFPDQWCAALRETRQETTLARSLRERTAFGQAKCSGPNPDARLAGIFLEKLSGQSSIEIDRASGLTIVG